MVGAVILVAAVAGDAANYTVGARLGPAVFNSEGGRWLNRKHLQAAHAFYEKYGGKTIILCATSCPSSGPSRPFVAGIGKMSYPKFALYNVTGAALWVGLLMLAGRLFGGIPWVRTPLRDRHHRHHRHLGPAGRHRVLPGPREGEARSPGRLRSRQSADVDCPHG